MKFLFILILLSANLLAKDYVLEFAQKYPEYAKDLETRIDANVALDFAEKMLSNDFVFVGDASQMRYRARNSVSAAIEQLEKEGRSPVSFLAIEAQVKHQENLINIY